MLAGDVSVLPGALSRGLRSQAKARLSQRGDPMSLAMSAIGTKDTLVRRTRLLLTQSGQSRILAGDGLSAYDP